MKLKRLPYDLTICKVADTSDIDFGSGICFIGKTDEEISLVCCTDNVPVNTVARDDGWRGFCIDGVLDFSLIGILSKLTGILAENRIGVFAVSTYNTDYILVKSQDFNRAMDLLKSAGYETD